MIYNEDPFGPGLKGRLLRAIGLAVAIAAYTPAGLIIAGVAAVAAAFGWFAALWFLS